MECQKEGGTNGHLSTQTSVLDMALTEFVEEYRSTVVARTKTVTNLFALASRLEVNSIGDIKRELGCTENIIQAVPQGKPVRVRDVYHLTLNEVRRYSYRHRLNVGKKTAETLQTMLECAGLARLEE